MSAGSDIGKKSKIGVNKKKSPPEGSSFVTEDFRVQSGSALLKPAAVLSRALWGNLWSFGRYRRLHVRDVIGMLSCCECAWLGYTTLSGLRAATWFAGELLPLPFLAAKIYRWLLSCCREMPAGRRNWFRMRRGLRVMGVEWTDCTQEDYWGHQLLLSEIIHWKGIFENSI